MTFEDVNQLVATPFADEGDLLAFYRRELPKRVGTFRLDEVGPIMSTGSDEEVAGYLENKFYFNGKGVEMGKQIDWYAAPDGDLEWNGGFVRHGHFMYLADRYEATGDEKYAAAIVAQMLDYIRNVPPYNPEGKPYLEYKKSTWRPFEVAGRAAENWPVALAKIISSRLITPETFSEILGSIYQHAKFLRMHHWKTGNHACLEVAGLGVLSIFYREFKEAAAWRAYAVGLLETKWEDQFYPDGYSREMSGAYHWVALRNFFAFYQVAKHNGMQNIFSETYVQWLRKAAKAEFDQQKPDFSLPVTNDSNVSTRHKMQLQILSDLNGPEETEYRLSDGKRGRAPQRTSCFYPHARLAVMRTDWTSDAVYACFDMGPWGDNHMNEDQLNLEFSAYGRNLLVNSGRWRYTTSPGVDWLERAQYFKSTLAYNSVLCDGMGQVHGDAEGVMALHNGFDYACGHFSAGYGRSGAPTISKERGGSAELVCEIDGVVHSREVFFVKETGSLIVRDTLCADEPHRFTQVWHMTGGHVERVGNICFSTFTDANFVMVQLGNPEIELFRGSKEPFKGWNCPAYDHMVAAPEINASLYGRQAVFETLVLPVRGAVDRNSLPVFEKKGSREKVVYNAAFRGMHVSVQAGAEWELL
ncbi:hypothetical protein DW651_12410 [Subdoligranulum sp. AM23-21AC]|jgi:hypothetical protein|uniref:heparinase II/III family protein n=1 Tax=Ruthenibacterium lactatiformans TaxID=1550024 RepID=UPI000B06A5EB|nr:heparinase II/III family protein [Ruthenibacterium lactatiformans]RGD20128.1 hypothetical protein DW651_12410 [Subdoligranulum sp. AM23-21AC]RJW29595.1 hypothetical protein DXC43_11225 [Subdoligranulum sp. TF05-17AC]